jgi:trypsin
MLKLVISLCLVALALGATIPEQPFQIDPEWSGRIVGGSNAAVNQFPHQASLRGSAATAGHFCGGTLVAANRVVSAAHCTQGRTPANTRVVLGAHQRTTGGTSFNLARLVNHPQYNGNTLANDICVLVLSGNAPNNANIRPIPMGAATVGTNNAVASGWGQTAHPGAAAGTLQHLTVSVMSLADCRAAHSVANRGSVHDHTVCTRSPTGQGMCMGDSGGPLIQAGSRVIGAVSWGIACARGFPDVFARISSFTAWINAQ